MALAPLLAKHLFKDYAPPFSRSIGTFEEANAGDIWKYHYDNSNGFTITNTSEPAGWDWTYTVKASDIPTLAPWFRVDQVNIMMNWNQINNDISAHTVYGKFAINDLETLTSSNSCLAGYYNWFAGTTKNGETNADWSVKVGDTIKFKVWADASGQVDQLRTYIQFLPSVLTVTAWDIGQTVRNQEIEPKLPAEAVTDGVNKLVSQQSLYINSDEVLGNPYAEFDEYLTVHKGETLTLQGNWGFGASDNATQYVSMLSYDGFKQFRGSV
jgi:hypothetical protein